jgi:hypothetical protein
VASDDFLNSACLPNLCKNEMPGTYFLRKKRIEFRFSIAKALGLFAAGN